VPEPTKTAKPAVSISMTITKPNNSRFITTAEAAEVLSVRVPTIHVYIRCGIIPAYKFGDVVRIPRDEFVTWLESTRVSPKA
jgi:excisionase family DNA binding protein